MDRWTIKELKEIDNINFAISILRERRMRVSAYSPLGVKLDETIHELNTLYIRKISEDSNND